MKLLSEYAAVRRLPPYEALAAPVASHPDMLMVRFPGRIFVWNEYYKANSRLFSDLEDEIIPVSGRPGSSYPSNIGLNVLPLARGKLCFGLERHTAPEIKEHVAASGRFVSVNQGYTHCSALKLDEKIIMTADPSIAAAARLNGILLVEIEPGNIRLDGYDTGFIGGAGGVVGDKLVLFGDVKRHPDGARIIRTALNRRLVPIFDPNLPLSDYGGFVAAKLAETTVRVSSKAYSASKETNSPSDKDDSRDSFWDISRTAPKRRLRGFSNDVEAVTVNIPDFGKNEAGRAERMTERIDHSAHRKSVENAAEAVKAALSALKNRIEGGKGGGVVNISLDTPGDEEPELSKEKELPQTYEYKPENPLIERVTVRPWETRYTFYDRFLKDARRLFDKEPSGISPAPERFFSYMPQYSQLTSRQLEWYLFWRSRVRAGEYPLTDYAYLELFISEVVNLPELISAEDAVRLLLGVWSAYREQMPKLDGKIPEVICDLCFINRLEAPLKLMTPELISAAMNVSRFDEFWRGAMALDTGGKAPKNAERDTKLNFLLAKCTKYDYRRSKFCTEENLPHYETHIRGALAAVLDAGAFGEIRTKNISYIRSSFANTACSWEVHRRIDVEYRRYEFREEYSELATAAIKYAENRIRQLLGIKARLTASPPEQIAKAIDDYFAPHLEKISPKTKDAKSEPESEYDRYYEPLSKDFSPQRAAEIERLSWAATEALTTALKEENPAAEDTPKKVPDEESPPAEKIAVEVQFEEVPDLPPAEPLFASTGSAPQKLAAKALGALLGGEPGAFADCAAEANLLPDALADLVNLTLYDELSDNVLEFDNGWGIVPDYIDEVKEFAERYGDFNA